MDQNKKFWTLDALKNIYYQSQSKLDNSVFACFSKSLDFDCYVDIFHRTNKIFKGSFCLLKLDYFSRFTATSYSLTSNLLMVFMYVLSTTGLSKESISKFLIGNRFHVKLRILNPENCKESLRVKSWKVKLRAEKMNNLKTKMNTSQHKLRNQYILTNWLTTRTPAATTFTQINDIPKTSNWLTVIMYSFSLDIVCSLFYYFSLSNFHRKLCLQI